MTILLIITRSGTNRPAVAIGWDGDMAVLRYTVDLLRRLFGSKMAFNRPKKLNQICMQFRLLLLSETHRLDYEQPEKSSIDKEHLYFLDEMRFFGQTSPWLSCLFWPPIPWAQSFDTT